MSDSEITQEVRDPVQNVVVESRRACGNFIFSVVCARVCPNLVCATNANKNTHTQDAWLVISAYFAEKGLVRQQLDSFDEFIQNTMQELVDDSGDIRARDRRC